MIFLFFVCVCVGTAQLDWSWVSVTVSLQNKKNVSETSIRSTIALCAPFHRRAFGQKSHPAGLGWKKDGRSKEPVAFRRGSRCIDTCSLDDTE